MILNAPPEIQISQTKHTSEAPINSSARPNATTPTPSPSKITPTMETTQSNRLTAPRSCIPRIRTSLRPRLSICFFKIPSPLESQSPCRVRISAERWRKRFV